MLHNIRKLNLGQKSKYNTLNRIAYYMKKLHCKWFRIMQMTLRRLQNFPSNKLYCLLLFKNNYVCFVLITLINVSINETDCKLRM